MDADDIQEEVLILLLDGQVLDAPVDNVTQISNES